MSAAVIREPLQLAIVISGRGSNMQCIASACNDGSINARVVRVIADRASATGLQLANDMGLSVNLIDAGSYADRASFDQALAADIDASGAGLVILAGFMRILGAAFCARYAGRLLNIHPSLLPAHKGLHTHRRVLAAAEPRHGVTVHYVTSALDGGPLVLQARVPVLPGDDETSLSARVQLQEHIIYPQVVGWIASGRLCWREGAPWLDGRILDAPVVTGTSEC
jgi:phosphoribosylglycinamide formyltransferase-1